jgi:DNA-directed RNA polymerase subunit M/transcription elongation factor TFIIS
MAKMIKYCQKDVVLLEQVFNALKNHIEPKTHYGVIFGQDRGTCPECGSDEITIQMRRTTSTGVKKILYKCKTCFKIHSKTDK